MAVSAFIALANALSISLWALIPTVDLGYSAGIIGVICLYTTHRTHWGPGGRHQTSTHLFALSAAVYVFQIVVSVILIAGPHHLQMADALAYIVFAALVAALSRPWELLETQETAIPSLAPRD